MASLTVLAQPTIDIKHEGTFHSMYEHTCSCIHCQPYNYAHSTRLIQIPSVQQLMNIIRNMPTQVYVFGRVTSHLALAMALKTQQQWTRLHGVARNGDVGYVRQVLEGGEYDADCVDEDMCTPLHVAAKEGHLGVVRVLISEFKVDVSACSILGETPLHKAASGGHLGVVRVLISEFKADVNVCTNKGNTPFDVAFNSNREEVALALMEFHCDTKGGIPYIHAACKRGMVNLVRALVQQHGCGILKGSDDSDAPFDVAVDYYREKVAVVLVNEFHWDAKGGIPYIHTACERGWVNLVRALVQKHGTGILTARDDEGDTSLHIIAAMRNRRDLVLSLINEFGCDVNVTGHLGRSLLHSACASNIGPMVRLVSKYISSWVVDDNGDTPLHICACLGCKNSLKALLELDPPVMIRNNLGQTPKDLEEKRKANYYGYTVDIEFYMIKNKGKIYSQYEVVQKHAKKKYSLPEPIIRAFVVGNPGAGKSSLVEALKREGLLDSFKRVSESSVPPHTAGIVPSIHTSKHYGRVLFYDFAGDAEYYSSHAAILENLASSRNGDNVFILVIDMREKIAEIKKIFHYWLTFIHHQQFNGQKPCIIVVGSHLDLLTEDVAKTRGIEFQMFYDSIDTEAVQMSALFMLDCCKPRSKQIADIQSHMSRLTKDSPRFKLSLQASTLLGLLEKDFSIVPACSTQALLSHIEDTGIQLLAKEQSLQSILLELHNLGLLFLIDGSNRESSSIVLNMHVSAYQHCPQISLL